MNLQKNEALRQKIINELGVDVTKYRDPELVNTYTDMLIFPKYAFKSVIFSIIGAVVLFILGFFVIDLITFEYFIYAILGLILFLISGLLFGILRLIRRMKNDILKLVKSSLNIVKNGVNDVSGLATQGSQLDITYSLRLLFEGVVHIVSIPVMKEVIENKIPLIGKFLSKFIEKILTLVADKIKFKEGERIGNEKFDATIANSERKFESYVDFASDKAELVIGKAYAIARMPFFILFIGAVLLLGIFIVIIN